MPVTTYAFSEPETIPVGDGPHRIVFVVPEGLNDADNDLLRRIASALKADPDQDILYQVHSAERPASIPSSARSAADLVVSFGVAPESFGWHLDLAGPGMCTLDRASFILTVSPRSLQADAQAKKNLWAAMQDFLDRSDEARR
jgi:hypothetical protein